MMECACKYYVVNKGGLKRDFLFRIEKYAHYFCKKLKIFFFREINFHQKLLKKSALWCDKALPVLPQVFIDQFMKTISRKNSL